MEIVNNKPDFFLIQQDSNYYLFLNKSTSLQKINSLTYSYNNFQNFFVSNELEYQQLYGIGGYIQN